MMKKMSIDEKRVSLRQRNYERTRQRILAAALTLFTTEGYDQTTMDAIAEQAEVGRATLFKYFPTKAALLLPLSQQILFAELRPQVEALLERRPTALEALHYYFDLIGRRIQELSDVTRALIKAMGTVDEKSSEQVPDFAATLTMIIRYGQVQGDVRSDIPAEMLTRYLSILYGTLINQVVKADKLEEYSLLIDQLLSFVGTGLQR